MTLQKGHFKLNRKKPTAILELDLMQQGFSWVAGVDEVGRGSLAGPVVAAAVILPIYWNNSRLDDSKRLLPDQRKKIAQFFSAEAISWSLGWAEENEVDKLNIHQASLLAMIRAVLALTVRPDYLLIDGKFFLSLDIPQQAIVRGDATCRVIAAASILAKVHRDRLMQTWHFQYPIYNFAANKGYGTLEHRQALVRFGPCPIHRCSYQLIPHSINSLFYD